MPTKKLAGAAAFTAALAAGGAAGALFGTPVLTGAQESESPDSTTDTAPAGPMREHRGGGKAEHVTTAAEVLGMTAEELRAELQAGKSIADVAAEKGVDKQKVIDALVAAASARIDEMKAQLPDRMADLVERDGPVGRPGGAGHHRGPGPGRGIVNSVDDAATALGISVQELRDELAAGKSIATIASEKGKNLDEVKAAMIADATERIDRAVTDGAITEERAAEMKANLAEKIDLLVQREGFPRLGHRGGHGPGPQADDASTTA
jgi:uncharacterized protein (DUF433 family)